jgi:DNA-binding XRE family transcriptional regulator
VPFLRSRGEMSETSKTGLAGLLRRLRTEAGLTQEELAERAGLSPRSVSDLERGINQTARRRRRGGRRLISGAPSPPRIAPPRSDQKIF